MTKVFLVIVFIYLMQSVLSQDTIVMEYDDPSYYIQLEEAKVSKYTVSWLNVMCEFKRDNPSGYYILENRFNEYKTHGLVKTGKKIGEWRSYNDDGKLYKVEMYRRGWRTKGILYDTNTDSLKIKTITHFKKTMLLTKQIHFNKDVKNVVKYRKGKAIRLKAIHSVQRGLFCGRTVTKDEDKKLVFKYRLRDAETIVRKEILRRKRSKTKLK